MKHPTTPIFLAAVLALAACSPTAPPVGVVKPVVSVDPTAAVRAIRAAGAALDSAVQVHPLRDPAIDGFLQKAHEHEAKREFPAAIDAANKGLKLDRRSPEIMQYLAELETARGNWQQADQLALKSYELGPKVGGLCARNWQTVIEASTALGDAAAVAQAKQRIGECRVPPRLRM